MTIARLNITALRLLRDLPPHAISQPWEYEGSTTSHGSHMVAAAATFQHEAPICKFVITLG
jgi:hypothetical protein